MERNLTKLLILWKNNKSKKPLVLRGARQIGKTYILKDFGNKNFRKMHYFNLEKDDLINKLFAQEIDPKQLIINMSLHLNEEIIPGKDLIVLDEIQACSRAITSLKYFAEEMPELHICAAGSLIGIHLANSSFPVGKVEFLDMYPMTFEEFLTALNHKSLLKNIISTDMHHLYIDKKIEATSIIVHAHLWDLLKIYFIVGGLPEVITEYIKQHETPLLAFEAVRKKQNDLLIAYLADIAKHSGKTNSMHIERVLKSIPNQMMRNTDNAAPKYQFKEVVPNIKGFERLAPAIDWLLKAGLALKIPIINRAEQPLKAFAEENTFKLLFFDVGLLGALADLNYNNILSYDYGTYKGYFAENFVAQEFHAAKNKISTCWREGTSEVEFLGTSNTGYTIPIEVKAGERTKTKSLGVFIDKYHPKYSVILSGKNLGGSNNLFRLPLYLAGFLELG